MTKRRTHNRRTEDKKWSLMPSWMDKVMSVCKWVLYVMPILCISIAMWLEPLAVSQSYVITAVWCLSLLKLIDVLDK